MSRFFVNREQVLEDTVILEGGDVSHIRSVLRMREGDKIEICDGQGTDYDCIIDVFEDRRAVLKILSKHPSQVELSVRLTLYQGLPKGDKMELVIQKAVELGATAVVPVLCKRSVARITDPKKAQKKQERWQAIAQSAAKQCGRGIVPRVCPAISFAEAVKQAKAEGQILFPYENATGMQATKEAFLEAVKSKAAAIFIGPEGGFDAEEVALAVQAGAKVIRLGRRILRTETAGLTVLSALMLLSECAEENTAKET